MNVGKLIISTPEEYIFYRINPEQMPRGTLHMSGPQIIEYWDGEKWIKVKHR